MSTMIVRFARNFLVVFIGICYLLTQSCTASVNNNNKPPVQKSQEQHWIDLHKELEEVSGIAFARGDDEHLYAIEDENGVVYTLDRQGKILQRTVFAGEGDYEDIALLGNRVIVLRSDGTLYSFLKTELKKSKASEVKTIKKIVPKGEYEALAATPDGGLLLLCKSCNKKNNAIAYRLALDEDGIAKKTDDVRVNISSLKEQPIKNRNNFAPSAITWNDSSGQWLILSSINASLIVMDENWKLTKVIPLDPEKYPQPEGLAVDGGGNLFITSEASNKKFARFYQANYLLQ